MNPSAPPTETAAANAAALDPLPLDLSTVGDVPSPALLVFDELIEANLAAMVEIAGSPARLRPHCKTHKLPPMVERERRRGVVRHKCATIAEAEMLAEAGAVDVLLAYPAVGPTIDRLLRLWERYPQLELKAVADAPEPLADLAAACARAGRVIEVLVDIDTGMGRTGIPAGAAAFELYGRLATTAGVAPGGLHVYDGQHHQTDLAERRQAVLAAWERVLDLRREMLAAGWPLPRIVAGGTGSFPIYAELDLPELELSPGTVVFYDAGYRRMFPELPFRPAAALLTRVISRPAANRLTLDLGYKAVAADPPAGRRAAFPALPDAREVIHSEEHLVIETSAAGDYAPGSPLVAVPWHICPTVALHDEALLVRAGRVVETWPVAARRRRIGV